MARQAPSFTAQAQPASRDSAFIAARRRYVEDELAAAIADGVTQYVVLGSGDSYADRNAHPGLRVFEVACSAIQPLSSVLKNMGFQAEEISLFSWLGVRLYETAEAAMATLAFIGSLPAGSSVVFDYATERSLPDSMGPLAMDALASRIATAGEPFRRLLTPSALHAMLRAAGFRQIRDLGPDEIDSRSSGRESTDAGFAHLVSARV